jgi:arginase
VSSKFKSVRVIGVPSDLGANIRGANVGPSAVRIAGLHEKINVLGFKIEDAGDITVPIRETLPESAVREKYLTTITDVCDVLRMEVETSLDRDLMPIVIGGDHSIAMGTISGTASHYRKKKQNIGLIWVDAHADMNTPASSPTGNIHGMPLSASLGKGIPQLVELGGFAGKLRPENVALVGIRTLDHEEKRICRESGIRYFTMREIDERGMAAVMKEAIAVATKDTAGIHVSFDIDSVDPLYAPGVSTPVTGGLSYREAHLALEMIADTGKLTSMEFVELNPMRDVAHKTAELLVELVQSALGKSIV